MIRTEGRIFPKYGKYKPFGFSAAQSDLAFTPSYLVYTQIANCSIGFGNFSEKIYISIKEIGMSTTRAVKKKKKKSQAPIALVYFVTMIIFLLIIGALALFMLKQFNIIGGDDSNRWT